MYAEQFGRDQWDFAVDLKSLLAAGCSVNDLRWLLCAGLRVTAARFAAIIQLRDSSESAKS